MVSALHLRNPPARPPPGSKTGDAITESRRGVQQLHPVSHKATVEDEKDENAASAVTKTGSEDQAASNKKKTPTDGAKYWVSERSIGEFNRTFNFPGLIQQDNVSAGLKDGILTVRVPKAPKNEARRRASRLTKPHKEQRPKRLSTGYMIMKILRVCAFHSSAFAKEFWLVN